MFEDFSLETACFSIQLIANASIFPARSLRISRSVLFSEHPLPELTYWVAVTLMMLASVGRHCDAAKVRGWAEAGGWVTVGGLQWLLGWLVMAVVTLPVPACQSISQSVVWSLWCLPAAVHIIINNVDDRRATINAWPPSRIAMPHTHTHMDRVVMMPLAAWI